MLLDGSCGSYDSHTQLWNEVLVCSLSCCAARSYLKGTLLAAGDEDIHNWKWAWSRKKKELLMTRNWCWVLLCCMDLFNIHTPKARREWFPVSPQFLSCIPIGTWIQRRQLIYSLARTGAAKIIIVAVSQSQTATRLPAPGSSLFCLPLIVESWWPYILWKWCKPHSRSIRQADSYYHFPYFDRRSNRTFLIDIHWSSRKPSCTFGRQWTWLLNQQFLCIAWYDAVFWPGGTAVNNDLSYRLHATIAVGYWLSGYLLSSSVFFPTKTSTDLPNWGANLLEPYEAALLLPCSKRWMFFSASKTNMSIFPKQRSSEATKQRSSPGQEFQVGCQPYDCRDGAAMLRCVAERGAAVCDLTMGGECDWTRLDIWIWVLHRHSVFITRVHGKRDQQTCQRISTATIPTHLPLRALLPWCLLLQLPTICCLLPDISGL